MGLFDWAPVLDAGQRLVRYDARAHGRSNGDPWTRTTPIPRSPTICWPWSINWALPSPSSPWARRWDAAPCSRRPPGARPVLPTGPAHPTTAWTTRKAQARDNRESADTIEREGVDAWLAAKGKQPRPAVVADVPELPPTPAERVLPSVLRGLALSDLPSPTAIAALRRPA